MMPVVRINDATFADLKSISTWFGTKTPSETIDRIVREAMEELGMERDDEPDTLAVHNKDEVMQFDTAPGLSFTKPTAAMVNDRPLENPRWSAILIAMIGAVSGKGIKGEKLVRELSIPAKVSQYEEEGYKFLPDVGISVQGQSAQDCWKEIDRLSNKWRIPVSVDFFWRQNPKAQYPGKTGRLVSGISK